MLDGSGDFELRIRRLQKLREIAPARKRDVLGDAEATLEYRDGLVERREVIGPRRREIGLVDGEQRLWIQSKAQWTVALDARGVDVHRRLHLEVEDQRQALTRSRLGVAR